MIIFSSVAVVDISSGHVKLNCREASNLTSPTEQAVHTGETVRICPVCDILSPFTLVPWNSVTRDLLVPEP